MDGFPVSESPQLAQNNGSSLESGKISAYYSLVFPNFTFYIQTLDVTIGRRTIRSCSSPSSSTAPSTNSASQVDVDLGALKSVSRLHARIEYDQDMDRFVLVVIGRNGAWVDGVWAPSGTRAPLGERSQIQIASRTFEFILPPPAAPPEDSPSPSSRSSTNRHRSPSLDITSISTPSSLHSESPAPIHKLRHLPPDSKTQSKATTKKRKKRDEGSAGSPDVPRPAKPKLTPEELPPKPPYTYAQLIYKALKGLGEKATLQEICAWIADHFDYYKQADPSWMSSVRHNLSSGRAFKKLERCGGERGKGFFWRLDDTVQHHLDDCEPMRGDSQSGPSDSKQPHNQHPKKPQKTTQSSSSPLTYAPRAISGPAANPAPVVQGTQVPPHKSTGATGVFSYPNLPNNIQNPSVPVTNWTPQQSTARTPASQPAQPPLALATGGPPQTSSASQTASTLTTKPNISISIVLGPIPPSHPEYSPEHPNNSKTEGYIVWDGRTLVLDPVMFSNLTKENIEEYERMGAQEALKLLSRQVAKARRAKAGGGRGRSRGRGGALGGSRSDKTGQQHVSPPSAVPTAPTSKSNTPTALDPPIPIQNDDEDNTIVIIDDSDGEPAPKRQKLDRTYVPT